MSSLPNPATDTSNYCPPTLAEVERQVITETVAMLGALRAAKALGIGKTTVYRKMREYGLRMPLDNMDIPQHRYTSNVAQLVFDAQRTAAFLKRCPGVVAGSLATALRRSTAPFTPKESL